VSEPIDWDAEQVAEDDFLAFWRDHEAQQTPRTTRILGVEVVVPTDIPLSVERLADQMHAGADPAQLKQLLRTMFGADHLDLWIANGLTARMMLVIVAWGMANGTGTETTFERAMELTADLEAQGAGKAPAATNRAARRASSPTGRSASTGRSSSPTSAASTTSRRKR
jgi:hypothetical protein